MKAKLIVEGKEFEIDINHPEQQLFFNSSFKMWTSTISYAVF